MANEKTVSASRTVLADLMSPPDRDSWCAASADAGYREDYRLAGRLG